jgi:Uma2 family endonuclease
MGEPAKRRATYEDVLRAPAHMVAEIIEGDLVLSPRPGPLHALATTKLVSVLGPRFGGKDDGCIILIEPELHLGPHVLVPDLAGWRRSHLSSLPQESFFTQAPDWVCETLSPSTEKYDRGNKLGIYAAEGTAHAWFLNPTQRTLEVMALRSKVPPRWELRGVYRDDAKVTDEPFTDGEFALDLGALWAM